jgi:hypothetical protein
MTFWGMIDTQVIKFPVEVEEANAAVLHFHVRADVVNELLEHEPFDIVEPSPGVADLIVCAVDFRRHPWGSFHVITIGFRVKPTGYPGAPAGPFLYQSPVDQRFSCEVGHRAQGVTTQVQQIGVRYEPDHMTFSLAVDQRPTLELGFARAPARGEAVRFENWVYTTVNGVAHGAIVDFAFGTGRVPPAAVDVKLGSSPLARELRRLGLPMQPVSCSWGEQLTATYHLVRPVADIEQFATHSLH